MHSAAEISSLMRSLDHWEYAAWSATALVTVGVAGESVHSFTSWFKRFPCWANKGNKASGLVLIVALALEFFTGIMTNTTGDRINHYLSKQSADATLRAANLGVTVDNIHAFVQQKEEAANKQMQAFQRLADAQQAQTRKALSALTADKVGLETSIAAVKNDKAELTSALSVITNLRRQVHTLTTHRVLTPQQWKVLAKAARPFSGIQFDMATDYDSDSPSLALQIGSALKKAGWSWVSRADFLGLSAPNLPMMGSAFVTGIQVNLCQSDIQKFLPAINALHASLQADHLTLRGTAFPDNQATTRKDKCGLLHIVIGSRT